MATLVATTVDPGGTGGYLTLNAAEAANFGASNANLTVSDEYCVCTCICTNGTAETTLVSIAGQTTDATHNITVTVGTAYRNGGIYPTGNKYRFATTADDHVIACSTSNVTIDGIPIKMTVASGGADRCIMLSGATTTNVLVENCIFTMGNTLAGMHGFSDYTTNATSDNKVRNCIAYSLTGIGFQVNANAAGTCRFNNCTAIACGYGIEQDAGIAISKNCIIANSVTSGVYGTFAAASTNNVCESGAQGSFGATRTTGTTTSATAGKLNDTGKNFVTLGVRVGSVLKNTTDTTYTYVTAVDSTTVLSVFNDIFANGENYSIYYNLVGTPTFQNSGAGNYHLVAGTSNIAYRTGADLDSDANLAVTTDIDGQSRHATTPCIGADEVSDWDTIRAAITTSKTTLDGATKVGWHATGAIATRSATIVGVAEHTRIVTGAITTGAATVAGVAFETWDATGSIGLRAAATSADAHIDRNITGAITLAAPTLDGKAQVEWYASGAIATGGATLDGAVKVGWHATGTISTAAPAVVANAQKEWRPTGTVTLGIAAIAGTVKVGWHADGAITTGAATLAGVAQKEYRATGAIAIAAATLSGQIGLETHATGAIITGAVQVAGHAQKEWRATGTIATDAATLASAMKVGWHTTGAIALPVPTMYAKAQREVRGTGVFSLPAAVVAATAKVGWHTAGSLVLGPLACDGKAQREVRGSAAIGTPAAILDAAVRIGRKVTGAVTTGAATVAGKCKTIAEGRITTAAAAINGKCKAIAEGRVTTGAATVRAEAARKWHATGPIVLATTALDAAVKVGWHTAGTITAGGTAVSGHLKTIAEGRIVIAPTTMYGHAQREVRGTATLTLSTPTTHGHTRLWRHARGRLSLAHATVDCAAGVGGEEVTYTVEARIRRRACLRARLVMAHTVEARVET